MADKKCDCIVLAAGKSDRMGRWKMGLPFGGSTVVETAVGNALKVCGRVILVSGHLADKMNGLFSGENRVVIAENTDFENGMFSSVQAGCRLAKAERVFLTLGDMPLVAEETYRALLKAPETEAVIPKYNDKKGHPLLMTAEVVRLIVNFDPSKTMRDVLALVPTLLLPVADRHIISDIDTEKDYQTLRKVIDEQ
jgi:molybdenum cofactor cytidylyltransferase